MVSKTNKNKFLTSVILNDKIFDEIVSTSLTKIEYIYLSTNTTLNKKQIEFLFSKDIDNVNINLLRNSNCSLEKLEQFINLNDKIYNIAIAHNPSINRYIIQKLLHFDDYDVTYSLKFNNYISYFSFI